MALRISQTASSPPPSLLFFAAKPHCNTSAKKPQSVFGFVDRNAHSSRMIEFPSVPRRPPFREALSASARRQPQFRPVLREFLPSTVVSPFVPDGPRLIGVSTVPRPVYMVVDVLHLGGENAGADKFLSHIAIYKPLPSIWRLACGEIYHPRLKIHQVPMRLDQVSQYHPMPDHASPPPVFSECGLLAPWQQFLCSSHSPTNGQ